MASIRDKLSDSKRAEIRLLTSQGVSVRSIAAKFHCSISTVSKIARENDSKIAANGVPSTRTLVEKNKGKNPISKPELPPLALIESRIARKSLEKAERMLDSLVPEQLEPRFKSNSFEILMKNYRLLTGQSTQNTQNINIQVKALEFIKQREEKENIINVAPQNDENEKPHEPSKDSDDQPDDSILEAEYIPKPPENKRKLPF